MAREYEGLELHRNINYELCTALDMVKFGIVLDRMVAEGIIDRVTARNHRVLASSVLTTILNENNRHFGEDPCSAIV
jgi:hypothetical protein